MREALVLDLKKELEGNQNILFPPDWTQLGNKKITGYWVKSDRKQCVN